MEPRMVADHGGQLEPVEVGHDHVDQHHGDVVLQDLLQRLPPGRGLDQGLAQVAQHHLVAQQLGRLIVDQQNIDWLVRVHRRDP